MTNEVFSLLDDVSEATIRMQGRTDTHLSQAMFIMREVIEMPNEDKQPIRLPDATVCRSQRAASRRNRRTS